MSVSLKVKLVGFGDDDQNQFLNIFQNSEGRSRSYQLGEPADIVIANGNEASTVENELAKIELGSIPIVVVGDDLPNVDSAYQIKPPLMTNRVIRMLDRVITNTLESGEKSVRSRQEDNSALSQSYRVLIVDDSLPMREQLRMEFTALSTNYDLEFCADGESALLAIREKTFDFVLLDIMLPGVDGYEVCQTMRQDAIYKRTPIIMLSGKSSPLDEVKGIMSGASTYLTKPIKRTEFLDVMKRVTKWLENTHIIESEHCA